MNNTEGSVSRLENQSKKNAKNGVTSAVKVALHKDLILNTLNGKVRLEWWKLKIYILGYIIKVATFYFENVEPSSSLYRFVLPFLKFIVDLTFGKILNIWGRNTIGKWLANSLAHVRNFPFLQIPWWVSFKEPEQNT